MFQLFYLSLLEASCLGTSLHTAGLHLCGEPYCRFVWLTWEAHGISEYGRRCKVLLPLQASEEFCSNTEFSVLEKPFVKKSNSSYRLEGNLIN